MVSRLSKHPALIVRDLITDNWRPTNVAGYDVNAAEGDATFVPIGRGWYQSNAPDPQITLTNFNEGTIGGGVTGYSGLQGDGSGANKDKDGTGLLTAHAAETGNTDYRGEYAEDIVWLLEQECERILQNNAAPGGEIRNVGADLDATGPDTESDPIRHFAQATVSYGYLKEPSG